MKEKRLLEILGKLEGLHTLNTASKVLGYSKQSTLNLLSKLKKLQYVTVSGGGRQVRFYRVTMRKQRPRKEGMFDILNKYNKNFKLNPWYDHQVHGTYGVEEAIVDAVKTRSFRAVLATLKLFNHVKDFKRLYALAKKEDLWQQVGALYDVAKLHFRVRKMPIRYYNQSFKRWRSITKLKNRNNFPEIEKRWHVHIPMNKNDVLEVS